MRVTFDSIRDREKPIRNRYHAIGGLLEPVRHRLVPIRRRLIAARARELAIGASVGPIADRVKSNADRVRSVLLPFPRHAVRSQPAIIAAISFFDTSAAGEPIDEVSLLPIVEALP